MAEKMDSSVTDIWAAKFDSVSVEFSEDGKMIITTRPGLFDPDSGEKVAESRPSKSSGKTQVVATTETKHIPFNNVYRFVALTAYTGGVDPSAGVTAELYAL